MWTSIPSSHGHNSRRFCLFFICGQRARDILESLLARGKESAQARLISVPHDIEEVFLCAQEGDEEEKPQRLNNDHKFVDRSCAASVLDVSVSGFCASAKTNNGKSKNRVIPVLKAGGISRRRTDLSCQGCQTWSRMRAAQFQNAGARSRCVSPPFQ